MLSDKEFTSNVRIIILVCLFLFLLTTIGCDNARFTHKRVDECITVVEDSTPVVKCTDGTTIDLTPVAGSDGNDGSDGQDGAPGSIYREISIPVRGRCVKVSQDIYVENEGGHADIYNNNRCVHGPLPQIVLCNDIDSRHSCLVDSTLFALKFSGRDMILSIIKFN